jgi:hypothetical protein
MWLQNDIDLSNDPGVLLTAAVATSGVAADQRTTAAVRKVSISRSGRYKSKNKLRARLPSSESELLQQQADTDVDVPCSRTTSGGGGGGDRGSVSGSGVLEVSSSTLQQSKSETNGDKTTCDNDGGCRAVNAAAKPSMSSVLCPHPAAAVPTQSTSAAAAAAGGATVGCYSPREPKRCQAQPAATSTSLEVAFESTDL